MPDKDKGKQIAWSALRGWFSTRGWKPLPFQEATWAEYETGRSGILHMPTGAGKTYAAYMAPLAHLIANKGSGTRILYITPLRALSRDITKALAAPVEDLGVDLRVEARTGDTPSHVRARQKKKKPHVLVTTPESLALMLSYEGAKEDFSTLDCVIVDEWHELISTKRGTLLELSLARVRAWSPELQTWALSATLANVEEAGRAITGLNTVPAVVTAPMERPIIIESVLPERMERFPWAGHLGIRMLDRVLTHVNIKSSTLVFTNVRSQTERWYRAILEARPQWENVMAIHHGSLDRAERERVEEGIKQGKLKLVVCTSSLDLGVDLSPVDQVFQIGSAKGIARLIQRAGRSGHSPGLPCRVLFVPTHAMELVEIAAVRKAIAARDVEARSPLNKPLDVLAQHLVTCALGGGFTTDEIFDEVRTTASFQTLTRQELDWTLLLVREGGPALRAYPGYHRIEEVDGRYQGTTAIIARQHRLNIGTITSDATMLVRYAQGGVLGTIEESYIARLGRGERFIFAGKLLQLVMTRDLVAYVKRATGKSQQTPRWYGGKLPYSGSLSRAVRNELQQIRDGVRDSIEVQAASPVLEAQLGMSRLPAVDEVLIETCKTREGFHLFIFPFEGRLVHEGLAALSALRLGRYKPATFSLAVNDYGLEILCPEEFPYEAALPGLFTTDKLLEDTIASVNLGELSKRQFREVARVAGLVAQNHPGREKSSRQLQASSALLYDVFKRYDPDNLLLQQAQREVLEQHFEQSRLREVLHRLDRSRILFVTTKHPTPLAFPLVVERMGARLSSESLMERIERMTRTWTRTTPNLPSPGKLSTSSPKGRSTGKSAKRS